MTQSDAPHPIYDVAVVGLGAMGSAALYELARRGKRVIGLERFEPGHDKGSSHGESRAIRLSYFEHPSYVPLLRSAFAKWRELEETSGERLLTMTGLLEMGQPGSAIIEGSLVSSRLHDLPHEVLDAATIAQRFPAIRLPSTWHGLFQPDGGILRPELCVRTFVVQARRHGATVRTGVEVEAIDPGPSAIRLRVDGGVVEAGQVIVATGPWIGRFAPELAPHLTLTRQVLGWFASLAPELTGPDLLPVWVIEEDEDVCYGFPDFAGSGCKAATHHPTRVLRSADDLAQDGDAADEARIRRVLARYMPATNGPLRRMQTCIYTRTPDEFFAIDHVAADPRIVLASPCSGHGFKFASVIGEVLADLALDGRTGHDIGRFRIDRLTAPTAGTDIHP